MSQQQYTGNREAWFDALRANATVSDKNWWATVALSLILGFSGADRFYLGRFGLGLFKLLTGGGVGIWWAGDVVWLLAGRMKDSQGRIVKRAP